MTFQYYCVIVMSITLLKTLLKVKLAAEFDIDTCMRFKQLLTSKKSPVRKFPAQTGFLSL